MSNASQMTMQKPQQNSYPFYIPKAKQQEQVVPNRQRDKSQNEIKPALNSSFGPSYKPPGLIPYMDSKQPTFVQKTHPNSSFNVGLGAQHRKS